MKLPSGNDRHFFLMINGGYPTTHLIHSLTYTPNTTKSRMGYRMRKSWGLGTFASSFRLGTDWVRVLVQVRQFCIHSGKRPMKVQKTCNDDKEETEKVRRLSTTTQLQEF